MAIKTLYTAVGRFERRTNGCNRSCPIILLGGQEYMVDMQEMVIWSMLNWRILRWDDIAQEYEKLSTASGYCWHMFRYPLRGNCSRKINAPNTKLWSCALPDKPCSPLQRSSSA